MKLDLVLHPFFRVASIDNGWLVMYYYRGTDPVRHVVRAVMTEEHLRSELREAIRCLAELHGGAVPESNAIHRAIDDETMLVVSQITNGFLIVSGDLMRTADAKTLESDLVSVLKHAMKARLDLGIERSHWSNAQDES